MTKKKIKLILNIALAAVLIALVCVTAYSYSELERESEYLRQQPGYSGVDGLAVGLSMSMLCIAFFTLLLCVFDIYYCLDYFLLRKEKHTKLNKWLNGISLSLSAGSIFSFSLCGVTGLGILEILPVMWAIIYPAYRLVYLFMNASGAQKDE